MKFYKRDPDAALAGMSELSLEQRGAYNTILDLLYSRDGLLPDDDVRVARMMTIDIRTWKRLKKQLLALGKIQMIDGRLTGNRVEVELKFAQSRSEVAAKSARSRWEKYDKANKNNDPSMPARNAIKNIDTDTDTERKKDLLSDNESYHGADALDFSNSRYRYAGQFIRLNDADYERWLTKIFQGEDRAFQMALAERDTFYADMLEDDPRRKKWFHATSTFFAARADNYIFKARKREEEEPYDPRKDPNGPYLP